MAGKKRKGPDGQLAEGRIQPLVLGEDGLVVATGRARLMIASGVVGERVVVRTTGSAAKVQRVVEPSPDRCVAACSALHRCGACCLQEMAYPAQLEAKSEALLRSIVDGLGCDAAAVGQVVGLRHPFGYRTKLLMAAGGEPGALRFGFYRRGTLALVPAEGCPVQHPQTAGLLAMVRQLLDAHRVAPSSWRGKKGWLHAVGVRVDPSTGASELTLAASSARIPSRLVAQLAQLAGSLHLTVNPERSSYPLGQEHKLLAGSRRTGFHVGGRRFALSAGTFLQSSSEGADLLAREVLGLLPEGRIRCFADLYGGAGMFALLCADRWQQAIVIEENRNAIGDLKQALRWDDQLKGRLSARPGRVEKLLAELPRRHPDVVVIDPPRRGCKPAVIEALGSLRPAVIIYVACGFEALLRDGGRLRQAGYQVDAVRAVDLFPHTPHLEVIARFRLSAQG